MEERHDSNNIYSVQYIYNIYRLSYARTLVLYGPMRQEEERGASALSLLSVFVASCTVLLASFHVLFRRFRLMVLASRGTSDRYSAMTSVCIPRHDSRDSCDSCDSRDDALGHRPPRVAAVVITLNEEAQIGHCLRHVVRSVPAYSEIVVCDGGSSDGTVREVRRVAAAIGGQRRAEACSEPAGSVVRDGSDGRDGSVVRDGGNGPVVRLVELSENQRGRARQMNAGFASLMEGEEPPDAVVFVHADSRPPRGAVGWVREVLWGEKGRGEGVVGVVGVVGFPTRIAMFEGGGKRTEGEKQDEKQDEQQDEQEQEREGRVLWGVTLHEWLAYGVYPLVFQPLSFMRGLRCLFGDQCMAMRSEDFAALNGFDEGLRIMEDLDMCLRVVEKLGKRVVRCGAWGASSGRRIAAWGEVRATVIHFRISVVWYLGRVVGNVLGSRWGGWTGWIRGVMGREYERVYRDDGAARAS